MNLWRVTEALTSVRRLKDVLPQMTADEVVRAIALEEETHRRKSLLILLYRQAQRLSRQQLQQAIIKEK